MWKRIKKFGYILYKSGDNTVEDDGIELAGYLTFLALLALFPFLVIIVSAAGFLGQGELGTRFITFLVNTIPPEAADAIMPRVVEIMSGPPQGLLTISILGAIWTSSSAVEGIRTVLNRAYNVSNPPTYIWRRLMSILQLLLFTAVIMSVMLLIVFSPLFFDIIESSLGISIGEGIDTLWNQLVTYIGALLLILGVANVYYILPNVRQSLFAVVPGAILVVLLWIGGAQLFTLYISNVDQVNIIYGSLGSFIATLIFLFIMSVIFIFGAEFNAMLVETYGGKVEEIEHSDEDSGVHLS